MRNSLRFSTALIAFSLAFAGPASAAESNAALVQRILASPTFKAATAHIDKEYDRYVAEGVKLTEIPAPPFKEEVRAKAYEAMLKEAGLTDVRIDAEGNAIGIRKGTKPDGKYLVVSAHLDTVFPAETDVKVKRQGTRLISPGIGDDTFSLAAILSFVRALNAAGVKHRDDIIFMGVVGEEGPGDLRGVRHLFQKGEFKGKIKNYISIESGAAERISTNGVGSRRYRFTFSGPGGHSYGAFGLVNPMYALGQAAAEMAHIEVPTEPKTTFNVGVIGGGTSVNSIPLEGWMDVDMRSESPEELNKVEAKVMNIVKESVKAENFARSIKEGEIKIDIKKIGDRPAGQIAETAPIVQTATAAVQAGGYKVIYGEGSSDSNIPWSMGIPAITIGKNGPGSGGRAHSLDEWVDVEKAPMFKGMTTCLSVIMAMAGME